MKRIIVVLGMHRSGTSLVTRGLVALGAAVGKNIVPAGFDNPTGFWEDKDIVEINDRLLKLLGYSYESLALVPNNLYSDPRVESLKQEATELVRVKIAQSSLWAVKDPRISRLLSFWKPIFSHAGAEVEYVIAMRNPLSVVRSLEKRNQFPLQKSLLLWLEHYVGAVTGTHEATRIFVDYDRLLNNPRLELARLANALCLSGLDHDGSGIDEFVDTFLSKDLCHNQYTQEDLELAADIPVSVIQAYESLLEASKAQVSPTNITFEERWSQLEEGLEDISPILKFLNERDYTGLMKDIEISSLRGHLTIRDEQLVESAKQIAERDSLVAAKNVVIREIYVSRSWRITRPLRFFGRLMGRVLAGMHPLVSRLARGAWRRVPVGFKLAVKSRLFNSLPFLYSKTKAFRDWAAFTGRTAMQEVAVFQENVEGLDSPIEVQQAAVSYVEKFEEDVDPLVKLIAFYLPQFHAIPENDEWWGEGFTEWSNVKPAFPRFKGHYQPHIPGELGYYNLSDVDVQRRQVELAKMYGLGGFCFYFYWFAGTRLLETPIKQYFDTKDIDFPFCLCWANENWSRRWDGLDNDILIAQNHSAEDDLAFIEYVSEYFSDDRYIRIDGKPLLIVYRPSLLPSAAKTAERWRKWCKDNGVGEIYLASTLSFEAGDPRKYGFDVVIEFPPNNMSPAVANEFVEDNGEEFSGIIYDWSDLAKRSENYSEPKYPLIRSVCPAWDNTARKKERATVFAGSTPKRYGRWLRNAITDTVRRATSNDDKLVFVNAWNEWAEGAHLEPDQEYGYAYLEATRQALAGEQFVDERKIVLVAHDAHPHGAQNLILHIAKSLKMDMGFKVDMVVLGDGPLLPEYAKYAELHCLGGESACGDKAKAIVEKLWARGQSTAICNTTVTGLFAKVLNQQGFHVVSLIHEMPTVIVDNGLQEHCRALVEVSDCVVFPAEQVREGFMRFVSLDNVNTEIRPQGLFRRNKYAGKDGAQKAKIQLESQWSIPRQAKCVVAVGYADMRKGIDLFVDMAFKVLEEQPDVYFVWVGHFDVGMEEKIKCRTSESEYADRFIFPGLDFDSDVYYAAADVYALTSREDPFPCVVLEALGVATPVVAFEGAGGFNELLSRAGGLLVEAYDPTRFSSAVCRLLASSELNSEIGDAGRSLVEKEFSFNRYLFALLEWAGKPIKKVSVIVPNYNYSDHMRDRLESITSQEHAIYELIVLDDASTDDSVEVLERLLETVNIDHCLVVNDENTGSPFEQWRKGIELASGDYIWIAEADDLSEKRFLDEVMPYFEYESVAFSYCESVQIDENGNQIVGNYTAYLADISNEKWQRNYIAPGIQEICSAFAVKNTVPNVSAVIFKRENIKAAFENYKEEIIKYRFAGDWMLYVAMLTAGDHVAFSKKALNKHRRHASSVTQQSYGEKHLEEVISIQDYISEHFDVPADVVAKVQAYRDQLHEKFNLQLPS
ncbi:MAG: glycoside hydrolase family 99-like domain-containing protein [Flavobacteriales bacterium]|nr:glycoside hydrolase family 99-like domain-containing protein [Flavobacteriales bacterium]